MKRIAAMVLAVLTSSGFISCANSGPAPFDVATENANVEKASYGADIEADGCYTNDDYGIEVICQKSAGESNTYNFVLFSLEDGSQRFFGTGKGRFQEGEKFTVSDITDADTYMVCTVEEDLSLSVEYVCQGVYVVPASGPYTKCPDDAAFDFEKTE